MQRFAERIERQRLHVVLQVRELARRIAARERAELRRRHAHRPAAPEQVFEADQRLAPE
jgi:hypothetical protein